MVNIGLYIIIGAFVGVFPCILGIVICLSSDLKEETEEEPEEDSEEKKEEKKEQIIAITVQATDIFVYVDETIQRSHYSAIIHYIQVRLINGVIHFFGGIWKLRFRLNGDIEGN